MEGPIVFEKLRKQTFLKIFAVSSCFNDITAIFAAQSVFDFFILPVFVLLFAVL